MDEAVKKAINNLIFEIDNLASCQRNISMQSFKDYPEVNALRRLVEDKKKSSFPES